MLHRRRIPTHAYVGRPPARVIGRRRAHPAGLLLTMPYGPVDAQLDLVALEHRVCPLARDRPGRAGQGACARARPPWIFYEGPPTANGKPGLHHVWARAFKDLFPRFRPCAATTSPARAAGTATAYRWRSRSRRSWASPTSTRSRRRDRRVQRPLPAVGEALRPGLAGAYRAGRCLDRHRRRLLDPRQFVRGVGVVAGAPALGQGPALRGPSRQPLLPALRHRPVVPRAGPARRVPRRGRPGPPTSASPWSAARPTSWCGRRRRGP